MIAGNHILQDPSISLLFRSPIEESGWAKLDSAAHGSRCQTHQVECRASPKSVRSEESPVMRNGRCFRRRQPHRFAGGFDCGGEFAVLAPKSGASRVRPGGTR
jgi:hypothetical protein